MPHHLHGNKPRCNQGRRIRRASEKNGLDCSDGDTTVARQYLDLRFSHGFVNEYNADPIIILYILWGLMVLLAT